MEMPRRAVHGLGGANVQVPRRKANNSEEGGHAFTGYRTGCGTASAGK